MYFERRWVGGSQRWSEGGERDLRVTQEQNAYLNIGFSDEVRLLYNDLLYNHQLETN